MGYEITTLCKILQMLYNYWMDEVFCEMFKNMS